MCIPSCLLLAPSNTARPVDARWKRIVDLADRGEPAAHRYDDQWVRHGLVYLNRLRSCLGEQDRARLAQEFSAIDTAYKLYGSTNKLDRAILEARLLARQTIDEVAAFCGIPVEAVVIYEGLFFQVLGRLDSRAFILIAAVCPDGKLWDGTLTEDDTDVLLKVYGYLKGPIFLEELIRYFRRGCSVPHQLEKASRAELENVAAMLRVRAVIHSRVAPFPRCLRAHLVMNLTRELGDYLSSREAQAGSVMGQTELLPNVDMQKTATGPTVTAAA
jgi:hypothetical protein